MASPVIDTAVTLDFDAMTVAQLRAEAIRLAAVLALCNDQRQQIFDKIVAKRAAAFAQLRISQLNEAEKDALRAALGP